MTSVAPHIKTIPSEGAYYINVASMVTKVLNYTPANSPPFAAVSWTGAPALTNTLIFKDLGKTVVSSLRTFRKVQLVTSSITNNVTVGAPISAPTTVVAGEEYYTGYIELPGARGMANGVSGDGGPAPVARLG